MAATNRIYIVTTPQGKRLVEAPNPAQAIAFVTRIGVSAEAASARDVADLMGTGVKVETILPVPVPVPVPKTA